MTPLGIGLAMASGRRPDFASRLPFHVSLMRQWYEIGDWDIRVPTGAEISAVIGWEFNGAWNIDTPTDPSAAPSWTVPDRAGAQAYTIWDIGVPTT